MDLAQIIDLDKTYYMQTFGERMPLIADRGDGCYLFDSDGKSYLDLISGIGVNILGHNHPAINHAVFEQTTKLLHCSNLYYNEYQSRLAKLLIENSVADQVFFGNSGAEVNEGAIKLARKYFKDRGEERYEIITAKNSFHGRTYAMIAATGQEKYQKPYHDTLPAGFNHCPFNDLKAVETAISAKTCAIFVEPIQGEGGVIPANSAYLQGLRELCDEYGILLIFDEIQTGMGRTGQLFAYQSYGVEPDLFTLAKGLGNGLPIGALLAKKDVAQVFRPGDHGSTFGGNPLACRVAYTTLKFIIENDLTEQVRRSGDIFFKYLAELKKQYPKILEVRGKGLMIGIEFNELPDNLLKRCLNEGILINLVKNNTIRLLPPLVISEEEIKYAIHTLTKILFQN